MSQQNKSLQVLEQYMNLAIQKGGFTLQDAANVISALNGASQYISSLEKQIQDLQYNEAAVEGAVAKINPPREKPPKP